MRGANADIIVEIRRVERAPEKPPSRTVITQEGMDRTQDGQNERIVAADFGRPLGQGQRARLALRNVLRPIVDGALRMAPTGERQGERIVGMDRERLFQQIERLGALFLLQRPDIRHGAHGIIVSPQILRALAPRTLDLGDANRRLQLTRYLLGYAILQIKNVIDGAVMTPGPDMGAALGLYQLHDNPDAVAGLLHAAFEAIGDAQFVANVAHIPRPAFVGKRGVPRDQQKRAYSRKRPGDRFDDAISQILLIVLAAHIVKGKHGNRWLVGKRQRHRWLRGGRVRWRRRLSLDGDADLQ